MSKNEAGKVNEISVASSTDIFRVRGILSRVNKTIDKFLIIEKELGLDTIYTLISLGKSDEEIADGLGITPDELKIILCKSSMHRHEYLTAKFFKVADKSSNQLTSFSDKTKMTNAEQRSAKHHQENLSMFFRLSSKADESSNKGVVVNNTIVYSDKDNRPAVPDDLSMVIEADYEDVDYEDTNS